jgi:hypothetical protein
MCDEGVKAVEVHVQSGPITVMIKNHHSKEKSLHPGTDAQKLRSLWNSIDGI